MTTRKPREGKGKTSRPPDPIVDRRLMEHDLASIGASSGPLPKEVPDYYSPGEPSEALNYLVEGGEGWRETVGAVEWLGRASSVSLSPLPREAGDVPRATWNSRLSGALTDGRMAQMQRTARD